MIIVISPLNNELLLNVFERGLNSLGESPKNAIWFILEEQFNIDRQENPINVQKISFALEKIFGLGYTFLDTILKQNLEELTGKTFQKKNFLESVEFLKNEAQLTL